MQNPLSYHSIRSLFTPQEVTYHQPSKPAEVKVSKPHRFNALTTIMPLDKVAQDVNTSYHQAQPLYITVARRNANLNTKDILFGFFRTPYLENERLVFEDVDNGITRLYDAEHLLATRLPE